MPLGAARLNSLGKRAAVAGRTAKTIITQGTASVSTTQSKFGGASLRINTDSNLNGIYVASGGTADLSDWNSYTGFTAECWVRYNNLNSPDDGGYPSTMGIMQRNDFPLTWSFGADRNGALVWAYTNTGGAYPQIKSANTQIVINTWYHIAAVKNGSTVKTYINGVEKASATITGTPNSTSRDFSIGSYYRIGSNAYIDEIRVSKIARYTAAFTAPTAAFTNDADTLFLCHADGANGSTTFTDDNA